MQTTSLDILEKTQLPPNQARAILEVMELEVTARQELLATKSDLKDALQATKSDLERAIQAMRSDLKDAVHSLDLKIEGLRGEIRGSEGKMARWVLTCTLGQAAMIAGAVYFALTHLR